MSEPINPAPGQDEDAAVLAARKQRRLDEDKRDRALVNGIRTSGLGHKAAWTELIRLYQHRLYSICFRMVGNRETAADLTQDAFVKILQGLDGWDGRSALSTWMIRVTMNVCLSHLRAAKLRRHAHLDESLAPSLIRGGSPSVRSSEGELGTSQGQGGELSPASGVERDHERRRVAEALSLMDAEQRAILVLRDVQGLEYEQIALTLGIATGTVKSRLFRARLALRKAVEELGGGAM
jgi:RNA polymerase sigma-70 factor (ECF subfamily)